MEKFQELLTEAAQLKESQLKNQRKNYESLPDYLKAGLNFSKKYQVVRKQHYMIQMNLSERLRKEGNSLFKAEQYREALSKYEQALAIFRYINTKSYDNMKDQDLVYAFYFVPEDLLQFKEEYEAHLQALYLNICSCLTKTNKKQDALHSADQALKLKETAKVYYKKAQVYLQFINRESSDIKLGFYYLNKCYQISKDPSLVQEMHKIKKDIDSERDKEKKWFKFMFDKNSQAKVEKEEENKVVKPSPKEPAPPETNKISQQLKEELERGEQGQRQDERLQRTKQKLARFTNIELNQEEWLQCYEGEFIAKHGSKIYSIIQLFGYKEYLGEYRALLAQCLEFKKEAEPAKRKEVFSKYFTWLRDHPIDKIGKYLERYEMQTKWIREQRENHFQALKKGMKENSKQMGEEFKVSPKKVDNFKKTHQQQKHPFVSQYPKKDSFPKENQKNDTMQLFEEVAKIIKDNPQPQRPPIDVSVSNSPEQPSSTLEDQQPGEGLSSSKARANSIKYISFVLALILIVLIKLIF